MNMVEQIPHLECSLVLESICDYVIFVEIADYLIEVKALILENALLPFELLKKKKAYPNKHKKTPKQHYYPVD